MYEIDGYREQADLEHEITLENEAYRQISISEFDNEPPKKQKLKRELRAVDERKFLSGYVDNV